MAGKKEKERFLFFKYVPKKGDKTSKVEEQTDAKIAEEAGDQWFKPGFPGMPEIPECPKEPSCPGEPEEGKWPELPEYPECPEIPELPEYPEIPECPEFPEFPECPEMPEGPCPEASVTHVIRSGDTFWKLAKIYGTTVEAIVAANPEIDPLNLEIGVTLCIPLGVPGAKG